MYTFSVACRIDMLTVETDFDKITIDISVK